MRSAYPFRKHKNQLQGYFSTIYSVCQMIKYKILYKVQLKNHSGMFLFSQGYDSFTIYAFYFKYYWPCSIIAAGNHDAVILCPTMHYTATLKCCVYVMTDSIPCFRAERYSFASTVSSSRGLQASFIRVP